MKISRLILATAFAMSFGGISELSAQVNTTGVGTYGMFGYRIIGVPALGVTAPGMFGNRYVGPNLNSINTIGQYATGPSIQYRGQSSYSTYFAPSTGLTTNVPQAGGYTTEPLNISEQPVLQETVPQPYPMMNEPNGFGPEGYGPNGYMPNGYAPNGYYPNGNVPNGFVPNGTENVAPPTQTPAAPPASAATAVPFPRRWGYAPFATALPPRTYAHLPALSNRLTQIGPDRGMLAGQRIEVSLSGDVALVKGVVQTSNDCIVLANVLGLEPGVQRIENRLITAQEAVNSPNLNRR